MLHHSAPIFLQKNDWQNDGGRMMNYFASLGFKSHVLVALTELHTKKEPDEKSSGS